MCGKDLLVQTLGLAEVFGDAYRIGPTAPFVGPAILSFPSSRVHNLRQFQGIHHAGRACALAVAVLASTPRVGHAQQTASSAASTLTLRPGDSIKLTVWKVPELSGEYPVAPDGTIAHPAFPSLVVAGVPLPRVQRMLDSAARVENVGARVVMQPLLHVVVSGEVRSPNLYKFPAGTSVFEAVILAGGRTERAKMSHLELFRGGQTTVFNLTESAGPATHSPIMSGDQLLLDREGSTFRESILPLLSVVGTLASVATLIVRAR